MINPFLARSVSYVTVLSSMLLLEARLPFAGSVQKKSLRIFFHLSIGVLNSMVLYVILFLPLYAAAGFAHIHAFGLASTLGLRGWPEVVATLVVLDCWDYWMHLANHRVGFLWRFHKVHHSDMEIDVTTASRFHIGELLITGFIKGAVIFLWGPSIIGVVVFETLLTAASQFHHSNLNIPFSSQNSIEKIIVTPRMHRCHHVFEGRCLISNYSTIFSFWDRLFATYHRAEEKQELEPIGVSNPRGPETMEFVPLLLAPFRKQ